MDCDSIGTVVKQRKQRNGELKMSKNSSRNSGGASIFWFFFSVFTAMVGHTIHGSVGWAIFDFFFAPLVMVKWLIFHEITLAIIKQTFSWFF